MGTLNSWIFPEKIHHFIQHAESQSCDGVGATVINGDPPGGLVIQGCTREGHVGRITDTFIIGLRGEQIGAAAVDDLPGFLQVQ